MATLSEYYETDFSRLVKLSAVSTLRSDLGETTVKPQVHFDHDANALFVSCYIPAGAEPAGACSAILAGIDGVLKLRDGVEINAGYPGATPEDMLSSKDLKFTGRVFFYTEAEVAKADQERLSKTAAAAGIYPVFRSSTYARQRSSWEKPLAFISHDSRDKDAVARPIAVGLTKLLCPVWYDEFSLKVGDRLRESIEKGLKECRKCVLILSRNFLSNSGWTRAEFNSVFTRELIERTDVILPVWHGVDARDVYEYSPTLADRVSLKWTIGENAVVAQLRAAILRECQPAV